jgi:hypothetical protein
MRPKAWSRISPSDDPWRAHVTQLGILQGASVVWSVVADACKPCRRSARRSARPLRSRLAAELLSARRGPREPPAPARAPRHLHPQDLSHLLRREFNVFEARRENFSASDRRVKKRSGLGALSRQPCCLPPFGKGEWEIGRILGVSEETVARHGSMPAHATE